MFLTLDNLAQKYKLLPSEALERGNTFDLYVLDLGAKWLKYQRDLADGKTSTVINPQLSQEEMLAMVNRVKERSK